MACRGRLRGGKGGAAIGFGVLGGVVLLFGGQGRQWARHLAL